MTSFHVDENHPLPKPTRIWGIGPIIGDCQKRIIQESDYDDLEEIQNAIRSAFDEKGNFKQ